MARRDFVGIRGVPPIEDADVVQFLNALKEDLELLMRMRGDIANSAVVRGDVTTDYPTTTTSSVPSLGGLTLAQTQSALTTSLSALVNDVAAIRATLNNLMINLKT